MTGRHDTPEQDEGPAGPGERRLERAPSDRYRTGAAPDANAADTSAGPPTAPRTETAGRPSAARGIAFGATAAVLGAAGLAMLGGALAMSAGLLVLASAIGYVVGVATVAGAADALLRSTRTWVAATLAGVGVLLGQVGLWLFARAEGGVLAPIEYLDKTYGPLVPLEVLLAVAVAGWRAR